MGRRPKLVRHFAPYTTIAGFEALRRGITRTGPTERTKRDSLRSADDGYWTDALWEFVHTVRRSDQKARIVEELFDVARLRADELHYFNTAIICSFVTDIFKYGLDRDEVVLAKLETYKEKLQELREVQRQSEPENVRAEDKDAKGELGAEPKWQPPKLDEGVKLREFSTKALMQELAKRPDAPEETRQRLLWDIADFDRPKWKDKDENPDKLPPELRFAPAPVFLKIAWADELDAKGRIYTQRVRHSDRRLIIAVEHYLDNRKGKDPLHAKGLTLVTGTVPTRPKDKDKTKSLAGRMANMR